MSDRFALVPASYVYLLRPGSSGSSASSGSPGSPGSDEVLLQLRQHTGYMDDHWAAGAAGHVERGETALDAARREAREELDVLVEPAYRFAMQRTQHAAAIDERIDFFFTAREWVGEPRIVEPAKCADLRWWPLDALPETMVPHERHALSSLDTVTTYLTHGFEESR